MKFPVVLFVAFALSCGGRVEADGVNITCPEQCTCETETLSCRDLTKLPSLDDIPTQFTSFFFYDCRLDRLSKFPTAYVNATALLVINSHLSTIDDDAFEPLGKLETLELSGNRLKSISRASLAPLKSLVKLDLGENKFDELPDGLFADLTKLSEVRLDGNWFEFRENLFEGADSLTKFTCNNCHLRSVPVNSLKLIKNLKQLELNQNQLQQLTDDAFIDFGEENQHPLLHLSLDNCSLESVGKAALRPFTLLQHLNLGHNKLASVSLGTFKHFWNSLGSLYLEHNQLTVVDEHLAPWSKMQEIKLGFNPWLCDCEMAWIRNIELDKVDKENVTCNAPLDLQGHQLHDEMAKMNCPNRKYYLIVGFGIPILTVLLVTIVCCMIKLTTRSRLRRGASVKYRPVRDSNNSSKQFLVL